jgi:NAD-dependent protein deacetylase/lipoamidase
MGFLNIDDEIRGRLRSARRVVAFSGAGVSKESGLDTFRGPGGLWERMRPEELATPGAFAADPGRVWRWYGWRYQTASAAAPNAAHLALAQWEELFPDFILVTQNVDGLHARAGSRSLLEMHGTLLQARCDECGRRRAMGEAVAESPAEPPVCRCGGRFRPAVVWFGENLDPDVLRRAYRAAADCDLFLSVGTSSTVYPAAGLIEQAAVGDACVIEINPEPTPFSRLVHLQIAGPAGEAVPALTEEIVRCRSIG